MKTQSDINSIRSYWKAELDEILVANRQENKITVLEKLSLNYIPSSIRSSCLKTASPHQWYNAFKLTQGNAADNNENSFIKFCKDSIWKLYGDKGYLVKNNLYLKNCFLLMGNWSLGIKRKYEN